MKNEINEQTKINLSFYSFWTLLISIVSTAIFLTVQIQQIKYDMNANKEKLDKIYCNAWTKQMMADLYSNRSYWTNHLQMTENERREFIAEIHNKYN